MVWVSDRQGDRRLTLFASGGRWLALGLCGRPLGLRAGHGLGGQLAVAGLVGRRVRVHLYRRQLSVIPRRQRLHPAGPRPDGQGFDPRQERRLRFNTQRRQQPEEKGTLLLNEGTQIVALFYGTRDLAWKDMFSFFYH